MTFSPKRMTERNPHTGEKLQSKRPNDNYRNNFDLVFVPKLNRSGDLTFSHSEDLTVMVEAGYLTPHVDEVYWGTVEGYSALCAWLDKPGWATHVYYK